MTAMARKSTFTRKPSPPVDEQREVIQQKANETRLTREEVLKRMRSEGGLNPRGKPKGTKNKITQELRQAVLSAGDLAGFDVVVNDLVEREMAAIRTDDPELAAKPATLRAVTKAAKEVAQGAMIDYLRHQAHKNPTAYMGLIGKVLPKQIDLNVQLTSREVLGEMSTRRDQLAERRAKVIEAAKGVDYHEEG